MIGVQSERNVEGALERENLKFAADQIDIYTDTDRLVATGHVVVITPGSHISADKADLDTRNRTGIYYNAFGTVSVSTGSNSRGSGAATGSNAGSQSALFGGQEPVAYFYGETVERTGPDTYKITRGGFTTCVQPTPRWDLHADTVILNVDHYTFLKQAIFTVKGVPMLYVPLLIYPTKSEDRATGFLLPTYGSSSLRGQCSTPAGTT